MNRLLNLFRRTKVSREISREMDFHISERTEQLIAQGIPREHAERRARRQFGAYALHKEDAWMTNLIGWIESLAADVRYALRGFAKSPAFAAAAILSLALGIGANTAIFSLIDAVELRSLPVQHPEQLQILRTGKETISFSNPVWEQVRDHQDMFSGAMAFGYSHFNIAPGGESRYVDADWVSGSYFSTLGVGAAVGRTISAGDDRRGCAGTAVLSYSWWQKEYGADRRVVGRTISVEGHPFEIIGVSQAGFSGVTVGRSPAFFVPICSETIVRGAAGSGLDRRSWSWLRIFGRMKAGMDIAQVKARLAVFSPQVFEATIPQNSKVEQQDDYRKRVLNSDPAPGGAAALNEQMTQALWILMAAVGLVLLIACANVANLMLARAAGRAREMAVRMALGAGRARLIRQTLTESFLLATASAALGLVIAQWGARLLTAMISTQSNAVWLDVAPNPRMLAFTTAVATATGVLFGLLPAWRSSRVAPIAAMKAQGRGVTSSGSRAHLAKALVAAQVALSMVLVAGAALMLETFRNLATVDPGFHAEGVLLVNADLRRASFSKERQAEVWRELLTRVRVLPGVRAASAAVLTPVGHTFWNDIVKIEDQPLRPGEEAVVDFNAISEGYFETLGTPLVAGRDFTAADKEGAPKVAIVNQAMARHFFGKASPLGRIYRTEEGNGFSAPVTIVGVVGDAKYASLRDEVSAAVYVPFGQQESVAFPNFQIHGASPVVLIPEIKEAFAQVSPEISIQFVPFTLQLSDSLTRERLLATLSGFFGGLALSLAGLGLYGVLSYNVERRRNEIGVRMALGALQSRVLAMILREASWLVFIGLGLGLAGTLAATQLVAAFLYGVRPDDPPALGTAAVVLAGVAAIAAYLPARRAAGVDPMTALRDE